MTFLGEVRSCARVALLLLLVVTVQWATPQRALAWFGWLDKFSGPGPYFGALVDTRLFCVGEDIGLADLRRQLLLAETLTTKLDLGRQNLHRGDELHTTWRDVRLAWLDVVVSLVEINRRFPVLQDNTIKAVKSVAAHLPTDPLIAAPNTDRAPTEAELTEISERRQRVVNANIDTFMLTPLANLRSVIEKAQDEATHASRSQNAAGAFWTTCNPDKRRRLSVELNAEVWWSRRTTADLADNKPVRFTTVMPSVTYRLVVDPRYDVLDIGAAAGGYWFSSKGFNAFRGAVLEPVRVSLHGPSVWHTLPRSNWRRWAGAVGVRGSLLVVPRGFGAEAFNGTGEKASRIPTEVVRSAGIFVNVTSILGGPRRPATAN